MDIAKAREVKKVFDKCIRAGALTDEDLSLIASILLKRLVEKESD